MEFPLFGHQSFQLRYGLALALRGGIFELNLLLMKPLNKTVTSIQESIFSTMTKMANEARAINLSQGFPDFDGPSWAIELMKSALDEGAMGRNQYAPSMGILPLREAIAKNFKDFYGTSYDPSSEVLVTNGATEALFCSALALLNPGDEAIVLEPFYDSYKAAIELSGGKLVPVTLKAPSFDFDPAELEAAINTKTKVIFLNNPHNPSGKMFELESLKKIAELAKKHDLYVISDEVYEHLIYEKKHIPFATLPDMFSRTITISSTGKTLGFTGWKIGWAMSSSEIIKAIHNVHQFNVFCVHHPTQVAMAKALSKLPEYLHEIKKTYGDKREYLLSGLKNLGFDVLIPDGAYFILAHLPVGSDDVETCKTLIVDKKVATIPVSAFYIKSDEGKRLIRFCFAKKHETLESALKNLK